MFRSPLTSSDCICMVSETLIPKPRTLWRVKLNCIRIIQFARFDHRLWKIRGHAPQAFRLGNIIRHLARPVDSSSAKFTLFFSHLHVNAMPLVVCIHISCFAFIRACGSSLPINILALSGSHYHSKTDSQSKVLATFIGLLADLLEKFHCDSGKTIRVLFMSMSANLKL